MQQEVRISDTCLTVVSDRMLTPSLHRRKLIYQDAGTTAGAIVWLLPRRRITNKIELRWPRYQVKLTLRDMNVSTRLHGRVLQVDHDIQACSTAITALPKRPCIAYRPGSYTPRFLFLRWLAVKFWRKGSGPSARLQTGRQGTRRRDEGDLAVDEQNKLTV